MTQRIDFTQLSVGTKVFSPTFGEGVINEIDTINYNTYAITVLFDNQRHEVFTRDGRYYKDCPQSLFLQRFDIPQNAFTLPRPQLKVDDKILVRNHDSHSWHKRYFAGWSANEKIMTFMNGGTSWTQEHTYEWNEWKIPTI